MKLQATAYAEIPRPAHEVFEAIVDPAHMSNYFISNGSGRLEPGQTVTWEWTDVGASMPVQVVEVEPDTSLTLIWAATGTDTVIEFELTPTSPNSTAVQVIERGWEPDAEGIASYGEQTGGWTDMLLCLKAYLVFGINLRTGQVVEDRR
jgi:uncharacterized protein YndB with AHSA1/START domain